MTEKISPENNDIPEFGYRTVNKEAAGIPEFRTTVELKQVDPKKSR